MERRLQTSPLPPESPQSSPPRTPGRGWLNFEDLAFKRPRVPPRCPIPTQVSRQLHPASPRTKPSTYTRSTQTPQWDDNVKPKSRKVQVQLKFPPTVLLEIPIQAEIIECPNLRHYQKYLEDDNKPKAEKKPDNLRTLPRKSPANRKRHSSARSPTH